MPSLLLSRPVFVFLAKMLGAYVTWFALYDGWLLPDGRLDEAVARNAAVLAGGLLSAFVDGAFVDGRLLWTSPEAGVIVADGCTGLAVVGLFVGFVLAYPGGASRRALFLAFGILVIHLANVVRIAALVWTLRVWPGMFEAAHAWGSAPFFYGVVFLLWMSWVHLAAGETRRAPLPSASAVPAG